MTQNDPDVALIISAVHHMWGISFPTPPPFRRLRHHILPVGARSFLVRVLPNGGGGLSEFLGGWVSNPPPPQGRPLWGTLGQRQRRWSRHCACGKAFCLW